MDVRVLPGDGKAQRHQILLRIDHRVRPPVDMRRNVLAVVALIDREAGRPRALGVGEAPIANEEKDREQADQGEQDEEDE